MGNRTSYIRRVKLTDDGETQVELRSGETLVNFQIMGDYAYVLIVFSERASKRSETIR